MFRVETQYAHENVGAWIYITNTKLNKRFMFKYIDNYGAWFETHVNDAKDQAERLIKFMRG